MIDLFFSHNLRALMETFMGNIRVQYVKRSILKLCAYIPDPANFHLLIHFKEVTYSVGVKLTAAV